MIFISLLLCLVAIYILALRYRIKWQGELLEGEIVSVVKGNRGLYGIRGYNYRVRFEFDEQLFYRTTLENVISFGGEPKIRVSKYCRVYFNPKYPNRVTLKGFHQVELLSYGLLVFGLFGMFFSWHLHL